MKKVLEKLELPSYHDFTGNDGGLKLPAKMIPWICLLLGGLLLHTPGIVRQFHYESSFCRKLGFLIGGPLEGVVFLMLLTKFAWLWWYSIPEELLRDSPLLCYGKRVLLSVAVAIPVVLFSAISIGDISFQVESEGETPDMWIVVAGFAEASAHLNAQMNQDAGKMSRRIRTTSCFMLVGLTVNLIGCYHHHEGARKQEANPLVTGSEARSKYRTFFSNRHVLLATVLLVLLYAAGAWAPVLHVYMSILGNCIFKPPGSGASLRPAAKVLWKPNEKAPNVVYIMLESMSGAYATNTEQGRKAMPFFQSMLNKEGSDMYHFPYSRSPSGDTTDCLTTLVTGCLPYNDLGKAIAFNRTIGTEFKAMGYKTVSFTSRKLTLENSKWHMIHNYLTANFDDVYHPFGQGYRVMNAEGCDDRNFLPDFDAWARQHKEGNSTEPFYAQFYMFNTHYPYVCDSCANRTKDNPASRSFRYTEALRSTDITLNKIFDTLNKTDQLENTIVVMSGDHGEYNSDSSGSYKRLSEWTPHILHPFTAMYVPSNLFTSLGAKHHLKANQDRLIATADLFPTLQHILYRGNANMSASTREKVNAPNLERETGGCITGFDLMQGIISEDRLVISRNGVGGRDKVAVSTKENGVYLKGNGEPLYLHYDNCTSDSKNGKCTGPLTGQECEHWEGRFKSENIISSHEFMSSQAMKRLMDKLAKQ